MCENCPQPICGKMAINSFHTNIETTHERLPERSMKAGRLGRTFAPNYCEKYGGTIRRAQNHYEKYGEKIGMLPNHYKNHQNIRPKCGICSKSHKT